MQKTHRYHFFVSALFAITLLPGLASGAPEDHTFPTIKVVNKEAGKSASACGSPIAAMHAQEFSMLTNAKPDSTKIETSVEPASISDSAPPNENSKTSLPSYLMQD